MTLIKSIYNTPEDWKLSKHYFTHKNGTTIWASNGLFFYNINGSPISFVEKFRIYIALRWWRINAPIEQLGAQ